MISITRLNGESMIINAHLIESIESTPDTTITMTTGHRMMVRETVHEVVERVVQYESSLHTAGRIAAQSNITRNRDAGGQD